MADRVAHMAWAKPGRRLGFGASLAAVIVAVALPASGLTTSSLGRQHDPCECSHGWPAVD